MIAATNATMVLVGVGSSPHVRNTLEQGNPRVVVADESDLPCPRSITGGSSYSTAACSPGEAGSRP